MALHPPPHPIPLLLATALNLGCTKTTTSTTEVPRNTETRLVRAPNAESTLDGDWKAAGNVVSGRAKCAAACQRETTRTVVVERDKNMRLSRERVKSVFEHMVKKERIAASELRFNTGAEVEGGKPDCSGSMGLGAPMGPAGMIQVLAPNTLAPKIMDLRPRTVIEVVGIVRVGSGMNSGEIEDFKVVGSCG
jgi:hypothetical protein